MPQIALMKTDKGFALNFYERGALQAVTPAGGALGIAMETGYPYDGKVKLTLTVDAPEAFEIALRVPAWCTNATVTAKGRTESAEAGYKTVFAEWQNGDVILLDLPMPVRRVLPPAGAVNEDLFAAYTRGPLVLAADKRIADPSAVWDILCDEKGVVASRTVPCPEIADAHICVELPLRDGDAVRLIDYASAGKTWTEESRMGAWLRRK
jgi:DUF1680 family protein